MALFENRVSDEGENGAIHPAAMPHGKKVDLPLKFSLMGFWRTFLEVVFGIGPGAFGKAASRIIHPHSLFAKGVVLTTVMFLLYTAVVVPVQLGFYWDMGPCEKMATMEIDLAMDTFFVLQIFYTFFLGHFKKGIYVDDRGLVAEEYLRGAFWFDVVTSIPVSYLDFYILKTQCDVDGDAPSSDLSGLKIVRALKPLRLLKMVRILRIFRILHVFDMIESIFRPPPPPFQSFPDSFYDSVPRPRVLVHLLAVKSGVFEPRGRG